MSNAPVVFDFDQANCRRSAPMPGHGIGEQAGRRQPTRSMPVRLTQATYQSGIRDLGTWGRLKLAIPSKKPQPAQSFRLVDRELSLSFCTNTIVEASDMSSNVSGAIHASVTRCTGGFSECELFWCRKQTSKQLFQRDIGNGLHKQWSLPVALPETADTVARRERKRHAALG